MTIFAAPPIVRLAVLLCLSGFSALIYQTLWLRLLGLVFGVTVYAASTVLAAFMAGLALGSFVAGRLADRVRSPIRWFGAAELSIAASALSTPLLFDALETLYRSVYPAVDGRLGLLTAIRFACSFVVLLIPTTLMGATMPLALRAAVVRASEVGGRAATLYAANTAGALSGALATGYYFVGHLGITSTLRIAAICNVAVGLSAILWNLPARGSALDVPAGREPVHPFTTRARRVVLGVFAVSGFTSLALEIIWFRALVMFLPATTYAFTMILAVVLGGIAGGSAISTIWLRRDRDWLRRLAAIEMAIAFAAAGSLAALGWIQARGLGSDSPLRATILAVLPATLLMGLAFPIGLHCWTGGADADRQTGDRVGRFYLVNLAGGILGAVTAGFLLIPRLGTRGSVIAVAACSLVAGLTLLAERLRARPLVAAGIAAPCLVLFLGVARVMPNPLEAVLDRRYPGERLLWQEEGAQTTVSIQAREMHRVMYLDGVHQADDAPAVRGEHRMIGTLAMALHPDPRDALVIGLGGGVTAGAVARFEQASVDLVELSPSVIRGSDWFRHVNGDVLKRANVHLRIDDGRNHLLMTSRRYDVITADIIHPFNAGSGNLYSLEYFQLAANALRDGGLMVQWIGHQPVTQYQLIARTFLAAFPHATVWDGGEFLVGTRRPLQLPVAVYRERLKDGVFGPALGAAGIAGFGGLMRLYTAGPEELRRFVGEGPVLTDDRPLVEYFLSLPRDEPIVDLAGLSGDFNRHLVP